MKLFDVASGEQETLFDVQLNARPFQFDWSRDGRRIGFIARTTGGRHVVSCTLLTPMSSYTS